MENAINTLRIQNFKSIKDVMMQPRRVNLIIGMPNVGKSNILEAMSLLGAGLYDENKKFLGDVLRYETIPNLFYDNETSQPILVESSMGKAGIKSNTGGNMSFNFIQASNSLIKDYMKQKTIVYDDESPKGESLETQQFWQMQREDYSARKTIRANNSFSYVTCSVQPDGQVNGRQMPLLSVDTLPKTYVYQKGQTHERPYRYTFLMPPLGQNLLEVVQRSKILRQVMVDLFKPYSLSMVLRVAERKFEIQKNVEGFITAIPYSLIADTLQRIIFYLAAIESNDDSVLLFEEPEAHTFPVYTSMLGRKIVESRNNQFFVATHSPYLVTEILEQMLPDAEQAGELAIFLAYYEDYQTKVKQLSDEEVREIRNDSIDVFYNLSRFTPGSNLYA